MCFINDMMWFFQSSYVDLHLLIWTLIEPWNIFQFRKQCHIILKIFLEHMSYIYIYMYIIKGLAVKHQCYKVVSVNI